MKCYSCSNQETKEKYLEQSMKLGRPAFICDQCGIRKRILRMDDNQWKEVLAPLVGPKPIRYTS